MKGQAIGLLKYIEGAEKHFYIPPYQRNYDWDNTNCEQLLKDISEVAAGNRSRHFFGSIITKHNGKEYIIIDGQQRIITVTLLLLALHKEVEESVRFPKDDEFLRGFADNPTYNSSKRAMYILERLENHEQSGTRNSGGKFRKVDLYNKNAEEKYTVEHIMPQNIKNKTTWKNAFKQAGDNPEEMHDKWLHRIGNLSLLTDKDNSDASNNSFEIKVELYKKSGLLLNSYIAEIARKA